MTRKSKVNIFDSTIEKQVATGVTLVAEKYRALHKMSLAGDFVAPAVVSVDPGGNQLTLERIHGVESIRNQYYKYMVDQIEPKEILGLFNRVGRILARIHHELEERPEAQDWKPSDSFLVAVEQYGVEHLINPLDQQSVQLHGDYGFANVLVRQGQENDFDIVIIDPCEDGYSCRHDWCRGPRYVDIGKMLLSIEGKVPVGWQRKIDQDKVCRLQHAFLVGYEDASGLKLNQSLCFAYAYALGFCYFLNRFPFYYRVAITIMYNRILRGNFPLKNKLAKIGAI